jgi:hypothetical protein
MIMPNVFAEQSPEAAFVESDDVIQQIPSATLHPALRNTILPRTLEGGSDRVDLR